MYMHVLIVARTFLHIHARWHSSALFPHPDIRAAAMRMRRHMYGGTPTQKACRQVNAQHRRVGEGVIVIVIIDVEIAVSRARICTC